MRTVNPPRSCDPAGEDAPHHVFVGRRVVDFILGDPEVLVQAVEHEFHHRRRAQLRSGREMAFSDGSETLDALELPRSIPWSGMSSATSTRCPIRTTGRSSRTRGRCSRVSACCAARARFRRGSGKYRRNVSRTALPTSALLTFTGPSCSPSKTSSILPVSPGRTCGRSQIRGTMTARPAGAPGVRRC